MWTLKLERVEEAGNLHSTTVGDLERLELTSAQDQVRAQWPASGKQLL